jgi:hypothetical protein
MKAVPILLAAAASLVLVTAAAASTAYDRQPVRVSGLTPDKWGNTNRAAQADVLDRYTGLRTAWCTGVIMRGYPRSESTWVDGITRYWDKSACTGRAWSGKEYVLIYDAKGRCGECFKIYRLSGIGAGELYR